ncbi:MAG TPA: DUF1707 domain-containing protein [Pseudonocardiaceae bacterium]|jgi:hypothetical protein|nr:DUF1707 domain-containing protein [Pseudonocardiaceae bacterium]
MDDEGQKVNPADLRVSHAEREHVLGLLQEAMARGMLDAQEFDERSVAATQARTRRDLNVLVSDIPVRQVPVSEAMVALGGAEDAVEMRGWFSSIKRNGAWEVPRRLVLRPRMGSVELDFTEAHITHPVVEIELDVAGGSVEMRLPEGASAATNDVDVTMGSIEDHRRDATLDGHPRFVLSGSVRWGSVELRGRRRRLFG